MAKKKNPNSNHKSGGLAFLITAGIIASMTGFSFGGLLVGFLVGSGIAKIASIMGSGLDTTTHNKQDRERQLQEKSVAAGKRKRKPPVCVQSRKRPAGKLPPGSR